MIHAASNQWDPPGQPYVRLAFFVNTFKTVHFFTTQPPLSASHSEIMSESANSPTDHGIHRWQDVAERRKGEIKSGISQYFAPAELVKGQNSIEVPEKSGILSERELEITNLTAIKLLPLIHNGTYTSVEVTAAFCKRAAIAHQTVSP